MSEYYLADQKAEERTRQKQRDDQPVEASKQAQDVKFTLLGDFLFSSQEPAGFDPYNHVQGKALREVWKNRRPR